MALIVKLYINQKEIAIYSAVRVAGEPPDYCTYRIDGSPNEGACIDHNYNDGAEALAVKVLLHQLTSKRKKEAR